MPFINGVAERCRKWFDRWSSPVLVVGVLGGAAAFAGWLVSREAWKGCASRSFDFLDLELTFSPRLFWALLAQPEPCRSGIVDSFVSWDLLFPLAYATFLSALYLWASRCRRSMPSSIAAIPTLGAPPQGTTNFPLTKTESALVGLPFLCAILDIVGENLPLFYAARWPNAPFASAAVVIGSTLSAVKWTLLSLYAMGLLDALLRGP